MAPEKGGVMRKQRISRKPEIRTSLNPVVAKEPGQETRKAMCTKLFVM
jgi:hypothetical protein